MSSTTHLPEDVIERVNASVHRIELPLPFDDLHIVNAYAVVGGTGVTLVDPGWSSPESEATLLRALASLGASRGDVRRTLVTHAHPDHFTLAVTWQRDYGIPIHLGANEAPSVLAFDPNSTRFPAQAQLLERAGIPALATVIGALPLEDYEQQMTFAAPDQWLSDEQVIDCDGEILVAHATPGHTRGHVVFRQPSTGAFFTGDHVLPRITPSIGLELVPEKLALANYLDSLGLLLRMQDGPMLSAHGPVTASVHVRVQELLIHHDERLAVITALVGGGRRTASAIANEMTWTRHERPLSALNDVHRMTAILEVLAHLDLLVSQGTLYSKPEGDVDHFSPRL
jgi:glyoxylase-like metal-dependent hydrolase (beta-lactamase superfamily II)